MRIDPRLLAPVTPKAAAAADPLDLGAIEERLAAMRDLEARTVRIHGLDERYAAAGTPAYTSPVVVTYALGKYWAEMRAKAIAEALANAPADIAALVAEVKRLRAAR